MKLSIIVPAFNEERYLAGTLRAIHEALSCIDEYEVIVVDNASVDRTQVIARESEARIVSESVHNISRVRNCGGRSAAGDVLVFVDADTTVPVELFTKIRELMQDPACAGGAVAVKYGPSERRWVRYYLRLWLFLGTFSKMRQGATQFCRRSVFLDTDMTRPSLWARTSNFTGVWTSIAQRTAFTRLISMK